MVLSRGKREFEEAVSNSMEKSTKRGLTLVALSYSYLTGLV